MYDIVKAIDPNRGWYIRKKAGTKAFFLCKDLIFNHTTGWQGELAHKYGEAPGYYHSAEEAKQYLDAYLYIESLKKDFTIFKSYVESEKQKQLNKIRETKMSSNYVVIDGKTINLSDETVRNLKQELGIKRELKSGDIVTCPNGYKYLAWQHPTKEYRVQIHGIGYINGEVDKTDTYYRYTGKNVFDNNLLNLSD